MCVCVCVLYICHIKVKTHLAIYLQTLLDFVLDSQQNVKNVYDFNTVRLDKHVHFVMCTLAR